MKAKYWIMMMTGCLLMGISLSSCIHKIEYDALPFDGKILPRPTGYTSGVTDDWLYFNLRTGQVFNQKAPNQEIKEGEQLTRTDWDFAFCGYHIRTNSGTSGPGRGGAFDLGAGEYDRWQTVAQLPADARWVTDTREIYVTYSQRDWAHYLSVNHLNFDDNPWFDPNKGPQRRLTSANKLLESTMSLSGPPMVYTPSYHTYVIRTADGKRYFKLQVVSWYNTYTEIDDTGGQLSYYIDELK